MQPEPLKIPSDVPIPPAVPKKLKRVGTKSDVESRALVINSEFAVKSCEKKQGKSASYAKKGGKQKGLLNGEGQQQEVKTQEEIDRLKKARKDWWIQYRHAIHERLRAVLIQHGLYSEMKSLINCHCYPLPPVSKAGSGEDAHYVPNGNPGKAVASFYPAVFDESGNLTNEARIGFAKVQRCGNANLCFLCGPKIRFVRQEEIRIVSAVMGEKGFDFIYNTLTCIHDENTDPVENVDGFNKALRYFKSNTRIDGYTYKDIQEEFGLIHNIVAREMTCDSPQSKNKTGIHYHAHQIIYVDKEKWKGNKKEIVKKFYKICSKRWVVSLARQGLIKSEEDKEKCLKNISVTCCPAFRVDLPRYRKDIKRTDKELIEYLAKGAGIELSPGIFLKHGRLPNRITHFDFIVLALTKNPELIPQMISIVRALKAHSWMTFSRGLREFCGLDEIDKGNEEKKDSEILQGEVDTEIMQIDKVKWYAVGKNAFQYDLRHSVIEDCKNYGVEVDKIAIDKNTGEVKNIDGYREIESCLNDYLNIIVNDGKSPMTLKKRSFEALMELMEDYPEDTS